MHLYFLVRGIKQQVELFNMFLQTQMFPWKRKNLKTGKEEVVQVQGALRVFPFGYEYVFPEESLAEVCTMLDIKNGWGLGKLRGFIIRHALGHGIMKIPKYKDVPTNRYIERRGIAIYPIGIKKDDRRKWEAIGYEQEML